MFHKGTRHSLTACWFVTNAGDTMDLGQLRRASFMRWEGWLVACCVVLAVRLAGGQGNLPATTVQLPTFGISIDAEGTLDAKTFRDFDRRLLTERLAAAKAAGAGDLWAVSKLRKVSLVRLEREIAAVREAGREPDDALLHLAGLTRVQYVFCYPAEEGRAGDVVIAGPAEPWALDAAGRAVGLASGRPVVELADLAVALRAFPPRSKERPFLGCTIDPPAEGLARLVEFQKTVPRSVPAQQRDAVAERMATGIAESLGQAEIRVFGISPRTHFAHVLVEADYRMKRIGIGVEPPPVKMATFIDAVSAPQQGMLQRWWFTPDYKCVRLSDDSLAAQLVGEGVQLLAEDKLIGPDGSLAAAGAAPNKASELFTQAFTRKFPEIAKASPVYAQLRSLIDLAVAAAIVRRYDYYAQGHWDGGALMDEKLVRTETLPEPRRVPCVVNTLWKGNRLLAPAGGGVSIRPDEALETANLVADDNDLLHGQRVKLNLAAEQWWWD
jgi:hypothetical protein